MKLALLPGLLPGFSSPSVSYQVQIILDVTNVLGCWCCAPIPLCMGSLRVGEGIQPVNIGDINLAYR